MPRYGPGQSGPAPPRRRARKPAAVPVGANAHAHAGGGLAPVSAPKRHTPAQGGAVLRRGTFQPENRRQQSELAQSSHAEGRRVAAQKRRERVQKAALSLYRQGRHKEAINLAQRAGLGTAGQGDAGRIGRGALKGLEGVETGITAPGKGIVWALEQDPTGIVNPKTTSEMLGIGPKGFHKPPLLYGTRKTVRDYLKHPTLGGAARTALSTGPFAELEGARGGKSPVRDPGGVEMAPKGLAAYEREQGKPPAETPKPAPEHVAAPHQRPAPLSPQARGKAEKRLAQIDAANAKVMKSLVEREKVADLSTVQSGRNMTKAGRRRPTMTQQLEQHAQSKLSNFLAANPEHPVTKAYLAREAEGNRLRAQLNPPEDFFAHRPEEGLAHFLEQAKKAEPHLRSQTETLAKAAGAEFKHGPSKTAERTLEKAKADYGGNLAKVKDAARSRIIVDTPEQAQAIREQAKAAGNLVGVKDRFRLTGRTGYGDLKLYLKHEGHVTELQVMPREVYETHKRLNGLYKKRRALPDSAHAEKDALAKTMHDAYAEAWRTFERRASNSLRSIGTPSESANSGRTERGGSVSQASIPRRSSYESGIPSASKKVGRSGSAKELLSDVAPASSIRPPEPAEGQAKAALYRAESDVGRAHGRGEVYKTPGAATAAARKVWTALGKPTAGPPEVQFTSNVKKSGHYLSHDGAEHPVLQLGPGMRDQLTITHELSHTVTRLETRSFEQPKGHIGHGEAFVSTFLKALDKSMPEHGAAIRSHLGKTPEQNAAESRVAEAQGARAKVRESLGPARARRAAQEGLYREERGKRTAKAAQAYEEAGGGIAGQRALKGQLRGELPKVQFRHLREGKLSESELEQLMHDIDQHPKLSFYDKLSAREALLRAYENGTVPQKAQLEHLSTVFGQDVAQELARVSKLRKAGRAAVDIAGIPRSLMAAADLSFPFRQGLVAGAIDPKSFGRNFAPMIRSFGQEGAYQRVLSDIHADPRYDQALRAGVKFTELGGRDRLSGREEYFPSQMAEKIPGAGHVVRASGRAFTAFADKERMDLFNYMVDNAAKKGVNVEDRAQLRGIARVTNNATGRGDLGPLEDWAPALNTLFFAPRLIASRVNFLNPFWYASLPPYARLQAVKGMIRLSSAAAVTLGLGSLAGARVSTDPRNADFAKLRIGDTRIDALGGFPQYARLVSQIASGQIVSSTTGKTMPLGPGFGKTTRLDILERFGWSKSSPPASFVHDFFKGTDFNNQPFDVKKAAVQRLIPLAIQDAYDLQKTTGSIPAAVGGYGLSAIGFGVQSYNGKQYANQKIAKTKQNHDAYGKKILEGAIKTGLLPKGAKLTPQLTKALAIREARYVNREKMNATDTRGRFEADVRFLEQRKVIAPAKADTAVKWARDVKRDYLVERELRRLSDWYFDDLYGNALADARQKLRDRGYDLPRVPR